jgi:hypothetical protein
MRHYFLFAAMLMSATPALAQSYPQYQPPQQEANAVNYPVAPTSYPQAYTPPPQQVQQQPAYEPRPSDAGQSVQTDVRQMNF